MADFNGTFGQDLPPFQEAVEYFLAKIPMSRAEFDNLAAAERGRAFTAAYVHAADQLQIVYESCQAAIEKGLAYRDFIKATENILTRPWHRETVFRTNVLSAYGAGHWQQAQEIRHLRPYARYSAVMDGRTRPSHAVLHGLVYPLDHPFWQRYWPPWDYNCRCAAITLSQQEVEGQGLKVSREMGGNLPPPNPKFQSPARVGRWEPDLSKYELSIREELSKSLKGLAGTGVPPGEYGPSVLPPGYLREPRFFPEDILSPSWKPFMTAAEGQAFIAESQVKHNLYFLTSKKEAYLLKANGFQPEVPGGKSFWGEGIYLKGAAQEVKYLTPGQSQLTAKINLKNPYRYEWDGTGAKALTSFRGPLGEELNAAIKANPGMSREKALTEVLKSKGFDGIVGLGPDKTEVFVVFEKEQVTVTRISIRRESRKLIAADAEIEKGLANAKLGQEYSRYFQEYTDFFNGRPPWEAVTSRYQRDCGQVVKCISAWQGSTNNDQAMALKILSDRVEPGRSMNLIFKRDASVSRSIAAAISDSEYLRARAFNQAYMQSKGVKEMTLHRGTEGKSGQGFKETLRAVASGGARPGDLVTIENANLAGYSVSKRVAESFGRGGISVTEKFGRQEILIHVDLMSGITNQYASEKEIIVFGGRRKVGVGNIRPL